jgi:addiction module RelB/DinJ family antitoxin
MAIHNSVRSGIFVASHFPPRPQAPSGRPIPGAHRFNAALTGLGIFIVVHPGRCPGLSSSGPSALRTWKPNAERGWPKKGRKKPKHGVRPTNGQAQGIVRHSFVQRLLPFWFFSFLSATCGVRVKRTEASAPGAHRLMPLLTELGDGPGSFSTTMPRLRRCCPKEHKAASTFVAAKFSCSETRIIGDDAVPTKPVVDVHRGGGQIHPMSESTMVVRTHVPVRRLKRAEKILQKLGLTPAEAVNMMLAQIEIRRGLPFEVSTQPRPLLSAGEQAAAWTEAFGAY